MSSPTVPFVYLSYPYGLQSRPQWMAEIAASFPCYDPDLPLKKHLEEREYGVKEISIETVKAFNIPPFVMLPPSEDLLKTEEPFYNSQVWRDIYFLIRSDVVVVAADLLSLGDEVVILSLAFVLGKPIILVSDRANLPPQLRYIAEVVVPSVPGKFLPLIRYYLPEKSNA